jgi:hypothetical protein|tara:strand:- start:301 stop:1176 length:876 start_codon:yes stop_codon:yes gene_type:complete
VRRNPYAGTGTWVRGSFHGHCDENSGCSSVPLATSVHDYHALGAGFVTLTDHDVITDLTPLQTRYPDLAFIQGFEYSSRENVVFAGPGVRPLYELPLEEALAQAGDLLTMVCHPQPMGAALEYWTRAKLAALGTWPTGLEIYNGHYGTAAGRAVGRQPYYADFWDELLTAGHRLWGFANDDFHDPGDFANAFNMVLVDDVSPASIIAAARAGQSYASTGILLEEMKVEGSRIAVRVSQPCAGRFIGPGGVTLAHDAGTAFEYSAGHEEYVRFEGESDEGRIFLQPLFREHD